MEKANALSAERRVVMPRWTEEHWDAIIESQYKVVDPNKLEECKPTNADRIRAMSNEELAEELSNFAWDNEPSKEETLKWLQSEAEE